MYMLNPESLKRIDEKFEQRKKNIDENTASLNRVAGDGEIKTSDAVEKSQESSSMLPVEIAEMLIDA